MLSKLYILTNNIQNPNTPMFESIYKHFGLRCPLQHVAGIETMSFDAKKEFYKEKGVYHTTPSSHKDPYKLYENPPYEELEYCANHWNIWNIITNDISNGRIVINEDSYFLILESDILFYRSLSNAIVYFEYMMSDIRKESHLHNWDMIYLSYEYDTSNRNKSIESSVLLSARIGIPSNHIFMSTGYLLSIRGLRKLMKIQINKNIQPLDIVLKNLQDGLYYPVLNDLFYVFYSLNPIFAKKPPS